MLAPPFNRDAYPEQETPPTIGSTYQAPFPVGVCQHLMGVGVDAVPAGGVFRQCVHARDCFVDAGQARIAEAARETVVHSRLLANVTGQ